MVEAGIVVVRVELTYDVTVAETIVGTVTVAVTVMGVAQELIHDSGSEHSE